MKADVHTKKQGAVEGEKISQDDVQKALALPPYWKDAHGSVYLLPDAPWSYRASDALNGVLAQLQPERAHAVLCPQGKGLFRANIQAGLPVNTGARANRWLIDPLPATEIDHFIQAFSACRWGALRSPVFRAWK